MAGRGEVHGSVVLDVTSNTGAAVTEMETAFNKVTANVGVNLNLPSRAEVQAQVDKKLGRGIKLFVDELNMPGRREIQAQLDKKVGAGVKLNTQLALPSKRELQAAIIAKYGDGVKIRASFDVTDTSFAPVIAKMKAAQQAVTAIEARELARRETQQNAADIRDIEREKRKADQRELITERSRVRQDDRDNDSDRRLTERAAQTAASRELVESRLQSRLAAQSQAFEQRRQLAFERAQLSIQRTADKPILQTVLINTDRLNASLAEFDRTISRALKTSLIGFTAWSAGVAAITGATAAAAIVSFAKLESATARASAVFAGGAYTDALLAGTATAQTFGDAVENVSGRVEAASKRIALQTLFNPTEIAQGFQAAAQAGEDYSEALGSLTTTSRFAQNEQLQVAEAIELVTGAATSSGKEGAAALNLLADQFTLVGNSSNATAKQVAEAFSNQGAAAFRAYGQEAEEALEVINLFGKANLRGLEAGTSTAILIREINNAAANKAPKAFAKYGISLKDANGKAVPFTKTLAQVGKLFGEVRERDGSEGFAKLRKELGLTEKSLRGLIILTPQLQKLGPEGVAREVAAIRQAQGAVARQSGPIQKTIEFQFQQTLENVQNLFSTFGKGSAEELTALFGAFNGTDGIITELDPKVRQLGESFGVLVGEFAEFVQSDEAQRGAETLARAVQVTLGGVTDSFEAFSSAFDEAGGSQSTFESIADSILAFSKVSATVLPVVAELTGDIVDLLIDNADEFESFAKLAIGVYAVRKAYGLVIKPIVVATTATVAARKALQAYVAAENVGRLSQVAGAFGLIDARTRGAAKATRELAAAQAAVDLAQLPGVFPTATRNAARSASRAAQAGNRSQDIQRGAEIGSAARSGAATSAALEGARAGAQVERQAATFTRAAAEGNKFAATMARAGASALEFGKVMGRASIYVAGAIALFDIGRGFVDEFGGAIERETARNPDFAASIDLATGALSRIAQAASYVDDVFGVLSQATQQVGRGFADDIVGGLGDATGAIGNFSRALTEDSVSGRLHALAGGLRDVAQASVANSSILPGLDFGFDSAAGGLDKFTISAGRAADEQRQATSDSWNLSSSLGILGSAASRAASYTLDAAEGSRAFARQTQIAASVARISALGVQQSQAAVEFAYRTSAGQSVVSNRRMRIESTNTQAVIGSAVRTIDGFRPAFIDAANSGTAQLASISSAAQSTTAQLLAMQSAIQAGMGNFDASQQSGIDAGLQKQFDEAKAGRGPFTRKQAAGFIIGATNEKRDQAAIRFARKQMALGQRVAAAVGTDPDADLPEVGAAPEAPTSSPTERAAKAIKIPDLPDLNAAAEDAISKLKAPIVLARTGALIAALTKKGSEGYKLTRQQAVLLKNALPGVDAALEKQRANVEKLNQALTDLRNTQIAGTRAASDTAFGFDQQTKSLQLQQVDLKLGGATDEDPRIVAIQKQIDAVSLQAQRADLANSLQLDPLQRKLEDTFNPVKELPLDQIIAKFGQLSTEQAKQAAQLTAGEAQQKLLNTVLTNTSARFDAIDGAAQRANERLQKAADAATETASAYSGVARQTGAAARSVTAYSTAVEKVPSGKGVVDKSLTEIGERVTQLAPHFASSGTRVITYFTQGVNRGAADILLPAIARLVADVPTRFSTLEATVQPIGQAMMAGFKAGMVLGFGEPNVKGSVADYLHNVIPARIKELKGPLAYDATILVPAGQHIMAGLDTGLRAGFGGVEEFLRQVGPSMEEFVPDSVFADKTKQFMVDVAMGKKPDASKFYEDLVPDSEFGIGGGAVFDPRLSFLHKTLSELDTRRMAQSLARTFGVHNPNITTTNHSTYTSSGNLSDHGFGWAADIAEAGVQTPTAPLDGIFKALAPLVGNVVKQLIYKHQLIDYRRGSEYYSGTDHFNHVHAAFLPGSGFSINSGKIGAPPFIDIPGASPQIDQALNIASKTTGVELALLAAIAKQESGFRAVIGSSAGAQGLMQLMPGTAAGLGVRNINDPFQNALGGAREIKARLEQFHSLPLALAGYNAGAGAVQKYGGIPPYPETQHYVRIVQQYLAEFRKLFGGAREKGGPVKQGKTYLVGETGPELWTATRAGTIIDNATTEKVMAQRGMWQQPSASPSYVDSSTTTIHTAATDADAILAKVNAEKRARLRKVNNR